MPNIAKVLKEEMSRISRHVARLAVAPVRKPTIRLRKDVADLKVRLALMEKANKALLARLAKIEAVQPQPAMADTGKGWISGKGVKSLRKRLGLSQAELAKLVGVSANAVTIWESKSTMLKLRASTKATLFAVRGLGAKEARERLQEMDKTQKATKRATTVRKTRKPTVRRRKRA